MGATVAGSHAGHPSIKPASLMLDAAVNKRLLALMRLGYLENDLAPHYIHYISNPEILRLGGRDLNITILSAASRKSHTPPELGIALPEVVAVFCCTPAIFQDF
jgi:hypothetical protein